MAVSLGIVCSIGIGAERGGRARNEDNYLVCQNGRAAWRAGDAEQERLGQGPGVLLAVCDGMGGHESGELASATAVRVLSRLYRPGAPADPARAMLRFLRQSHERLHFKAREHGPVKMGTTVTLAWILGNQLAFAHVGDSRLYLFRDGRLKQLTSDHTRSEFARRDGLPDPPEGEHLAQCFIYGSRGLGDDARLRIELGFDAASVELQRGDQLLLCSDGLCGVVDDASIADVLAHTTSPQSAAVSCMERAIARGSTDNITVMVARVDELADDGKPNDFEETDDESTVWF